MLDILNVQVYNMNITNILRGDDCVNRIRELRKSRNIKQVELCKSLGITQGALSGWENGKYEPDISSLKKMSKIFDISIDELLGKATPSNPNVIKIPILGQVAAGVPIEAIEEVAGYEELDAQEFSPDYEYFGLKIKGDSMMPRIHKGDVVIVRKQSDIDNGDVAIVCVNGDEATCKQVKKHTNGITLISYNSVYEPMFFTNEEIESKPITILGKVVELRGKF